MKKIIACIFILFTFFSVLQAQDQRCANHDSKAHQRFEQWLAQQRQEKELQNAARQERTESTYTIPVVFHVLHKGEALGEGANVSMAQLQSQIDVLNEDYNRQNADTTNTPANFKRVAASANIKFQLADFDSLNKPLAEKGVMRYRWNKGSFELDEMNSVVKPQTVWNPYKYLNIWVIDTLLINGGRFLGYAQFPWQSGLQGLAPTDGTRQTEGVIVVKRALGSYRKVQVPQLSPTYAYNLGRTLTHEIGHYLGVLHTFGGCNEAVDYCSDTPAQLTDTRGCPTSPVSCGGVPMVQNFLDYSFDACMNIFTRCQVERMRTVLERSPMRKELLSSPAIILSDNNEVISSQINLFPNPAQHQLQLAIPEGILAKNYRITNMLGQTVQIGELNNLAIQLQLPQGLYLLQLATNKGNVVKKFLVE
jgi:zinc-dependent metalloproteinase lipoprotein